MSDVDIAHFFWLDGVARYGDLLRVTPAPDADHMGRSAAYEDCIRHGWIVSGVDPGTWMLSRLGHDALCRAKIDPHIARQIIIR